MTFLKIAAVLAVLTPLAACGSGPTGPLAYGAVDSHNAYPLAPPNCLKRQFPQCGSTGEGG